MWIPFCSDGMIPQECIANQCQRSGAVDASPRPPINDIIGNQALHEREDSCVENPTAVRTVSHGTPND